MNQLQALIETLTVAQRHGMADMDGLAEGCDYWHLQDMVERVSAAQEMGQPFAFSEAKLGRWLGWAQCAVVAANIGLSLDDMKQLNARLA